MENSKLFIKDLIKKSNSKNNLFKRNIIKEYLQIVVLDFIYSDPKYSHLVFYGGSCLAHCYDLPRLSEDLDFVDLKKINSLSGLSSDLKMFFLKKTDLNPSISVQKFRIYLKFPILRDLGLATASESDLLFLKVEVFGKFEFCKKFKTEMVPLFKFNKSIIIKTFDLPTLFATKIGAILGRKWEKIDKTGKITARVKGRDYFDLMWYLQKGVRPNLKCIDGVSSLENLRERLEMQIEKVDKRSILLDLEALIEDKEFVDKLSSNLKEILKREVGKI